MELLKIQPVFTHNIWGGDRLSKDFGYDIEGSDIGECWGISAHPNGEGVIKGGEYDGVKLSELWVTHPELFGNVSFDRFPLLIKIIDAKDDLSIQVHPDDEYAKIHENGSLGKTECWYILDCDEGGTIVVGHNAKTKEELKDMIEKGRWNDFIREIPIKKGDFIQIDPGTVHAIKGGTLILETQQNSDITYRVYDYDRLQNGKPRQLHVSQSIDVITVPAKSPEDSVKDMSVLPVNQINVMYSCKYYTVSKIAVDGSFTMNNTKPFLNVTVIEGEGSINGEQVKKGDHMIVPAGVSSLKFEGQFEMIVSSI
ncbi:MAG: mannose-6-phosphate isomerase, class I [Lachnospiraceae bacterium]|nr:mannose-6-phosphate isomerase, class I [Lachnospiraceae bacterium]